MAAKRWCVFCRAELIPNMSGELAFSCARCRAAGMTAGIVSGQGSFGHLSSGQIATGHISNGIRTARAAPVAYRLRRDRFDGLVLQGLYEEYNGNEIMHTWRDIPLVDSDLSEEPHTGGYL